MQPARLPETTRVGQGLLLLQKQFRRSLTSIHKWRIK